MKILAIDTSTISGSLAVLTDGRVTAEWTLQSAQTHNRRLMKTLDALLHEAECPLASVDAYAVTIGPGSFTGLRIGLTTAKTLAWAMNKPLIGIPTLDVLAAPLRFSSLPVCTMLDARKKEVYFSLYRSDPEGRMRRLQPCRAVQPAIIADLIRERTIFCGDGWLLYGKLLLERLGNLAVEAPASFHILRASVLAELAQKNLESGHDSDPMTIIPFYVRLPEAEIKFPQFSAGEQPSDQDRDAIPYI